MQKAILGGVAGLLVLVSAGAAVAQPGWVGPRYGWQGHWYHHRTWVWAPGHRGYWRYW